MAGGSARSLVRSVQPVVEPEPEPAVVATSPTNAPDPSNAGQHGSGADALALLEEESGLTAASQWKGSLGLQGAGKSATGSSNFFFRAAVGVEWKSLLDTVKIDGVYYFATSDGVTSDNKASAVAEWNRDFKEASRWFFFSRAEWEMDQLFAWEQRVGAYVGAGFQAIEEEDWHLTLKVAPGAERVFGNVERWFPNLLMRVESKWKLDGVWALHANAEYLPDLANFTEDYTIYAEAKLIGKMSFLEGLAFETGVSNEYDTFQPDGGTNDFRYYAGLRYEF